MNKKIEKYAVFCGSRFGSQPDFKDDAVSIGEGLGKRGLTLVYGGGAVGLMGVVADHTLKSGGKVHGVIPEFLHDRETKHEGIHTLEITQTMMERKARLFALGDAFIVLPGGLGTLDEFSEVLVDAQLDIAQKPIYIINTCGWADKLLEFFDELHSIGFVDKKLSEHFKVFPDARSFFASIDA